MAKPRNTVKSKSNSKATASKKSVERLSTKSKSAAKAPVSEEYAEYLERYELYGEGRSRLKPSEFDELDDELLDLLAIELERGLTDEQTIRLKELEYLLLDSEQ